MTGSNSPSPAASRTSSSPSPSSKAAPPNTPEPPSTPRPTPTPATPRSPTSCPSPPPSCAPTPVTATAPPTLYERIGTSFYFGEFGPLGDPRLRPERTVSFDFGFDQYFANSRYRVSSTYFYTRLQEVISYGGLNNDPFGRYGGYVNLGGGLARGLELSVEARPYRHLIVTSSYTYTNADERNSSLIGGSLRSIRVFPHMYTLVATHQITRRLQITADFLAASDYISGSFFVGSGSRPYQFAGPRRLDTAANYTLPLTERVSLRFYTRIENLLNQRYFEDGFRTPRRWATGGMKLSF